VTPFLIQWRPESSGYLIRSILWSTQSWNCVRNQRAFRHSARKRPLNALDEGVVSGLARTGEIPGDVMGTDP
jgi:hypothetical protein